MKRYVIAAVGVLVVMIGVVVYITCFLKLPDVPRLESRYSLVQVTEKHGNSKLINWSANYDIRDYYISELSNGKLRVMYIAVIPNPSDGFYRAGRGEVDLFYNIRTDNTVNLLLHYDALDDSPNRAVIKIQGEALVFEYYFGSELIYTAKYIEDLPNVV